MRTFTSDAGTVTRFSCGISLKELLTARKDFHLVLARLPSPLKLRRDKTARQASNANNRRPTWLLLRRSGDIIAIMRCVTMEAEIDHGRVIPKEPEKLPLTGKALLTVLNSTGEKPDWDRIIGLLGTMHEKVDGLTIERESRAGWDRRPRSQE